jgi:large repetitive protein
LKFSQITFKSYDEYPNIQENILIVITAKTNTMNTFNPNKKIYITVIVGLLLIAINIKLAFATPPCQIVTQSFQNMADGATSDNGTYGWSLSPTTISGATYWAIQSKRFKAQEIGQEGVWTSKVMTITGYPNVQIGVKITAEGTLTSSEYVKIYYKLNGGAETLMSQQTGNFGTQDLSSVTLNGNTVQIVIRIKNTKKTGVGVQSIYYIEQYRLFSNVTGCSLAVAPSVSGTVTCVNPSVTLSANPNTTGATFQWTGPNGFTSTQQNPVVTAGGTYNVTASISASSSTATGSVTVLQNTTTPGATANSAVTLTCSTTSVPLSGGSATSGVTYRWTGPNSFTSTVQNPSVSNPGLYTLTVTNPVNGCTSTATTNVTQDISTPGATATASGILTCSVTSISISGNPASGVTYSWTGPNSFTSTSQNPSVSSPGVYTLTVRKTSNGCTSIDTANVTQNITAPGATAIAGDTLTCVVTSVVISGNSGASGVTYSWTGPNGFSSNQLTAIVSNPGTYTFTVTNPSNGCSSGAAVNVLQTTTGPNISATVSGTINCTTGYVTISGSSSTSGVSFSWVGPNGFSSNQSSAIVSTPGTYTLTAASPLNNCTSTATVDVTENTTVPGATASVSGTLTCVVLAVSITGSSNASGVNYSWTGPEGFSSNQSSFSASTPGTYHLTVTNPVNNCTSVSSVGVIEIKTLPGATVSVSDTLTCTRASVTITGSSGTTGVNYNWTGPNGFSSSQSVTSVSLPGKYILTVTNPANSCTSTEEVNVVKVANYPGVTINYTGTLTCTVTSVTLTGNSGTPGVSYNWTGPNGFSSNQAVVSASTPGTYTLTVTNPVNSCSSIASTNVIQNILPPGASANVTGTLTCTTTSVTITGNSGTPGATYNWTGPNGFTSSLQNITVSNAGTYNLITTDPANGCASQAPAIVNSNITVPGATASVSGPLTCTTSSVTLTGSSGTTGVTYSWAGPNGFASTTQNPTVNTAGSYTLSVTNPVNGCISSANVNVIQASTSPGATASASGALNCAATTVTLTGTSNTSGVQYSWTGPNSFTSSSQNPVINTAGTYILTVTNPSNGCTSTGSVTVSQNTTTPDISASGGVLSCSGSLILNANSGVSGVTYNWTGPNGFTSTSQNPTVNTSGSFTVTVSNPANACTNSQTALVTASAGSSSTFWLEDFTLTNGTTSDAGTTGWTSSTAGSGTFSVQNNEFKGSFASGNTSEGVWTSNVIDISSKSNVIISADLRSETASSSDYFETSDYINVYYKLNGGAETLIYGDVAGLGSTTNGTATATATSPSLNGNTLQVVIRIKNSDPTERYYFDNVKLTGIVPVTSSASVGGIITCSTPSITLSGSSNTSGVTYSWSGPNSFASTSQNPTVSNPGNYILTVVNPANGCTSTATVNVTKNTTAPGATASVSGAINCITSSVTLSGNSGTPGVTFNWTGPNSFTSNSQNPSVTAGGSYTLTVTNPANGCTSSQSVQVISNTGTISTLWLEDFNGLANGTTTDNGATSWTRTYSGSTGHWYIQSNQFEGNYISPEAVWKSQVINIASSTNVTISMDVTGVGTLNVNEDYFRAYYILNGGSEIPFISYNQNGAFGTITSTSPALNGSTLQIVVRAYNTYSDEIYQFDNVKVTGNSPGSLDVTASVNGTLTCTNPSATLFTSISSSGNTFSWTGPNGYISTQANPVATLPGSYTVIATSASGCSGSASVNVLQDNGQPGVTATGGSIGCSASSVTLTANSSTSGVTYNWTGPNGFTSTLQNPTASFIGSYTVVATNPVNGCTSSASATITSFQASTLWLEDFNDLSDGTIVDNGTTAWTRTYSGTCGYWEARSNKMTGHYLGSEATWRSQIINIAPYSNLTVSIDFSGEGSLDPGQDYIKVFYVLNGGDEIPFVNYNQQDGPFNTVTAISPTLLEGNTLQIVVRASNTGSSEYYRFDNVKVIENTNSYLPVTASVSDVLTCSRSQVTLSTNISSSGTTYNWTGPEGFTSTQSNPAITQPGIYYVSVVNASGCNGTSSVTVIQDMAQPGITATGGAIECSASTVTLTANSSTSGVTYSWSGPNGFTSSQQNPVVSVTGNYTVVATNPVNGCASSASVNVTAGQVTTLWLENFNDLASGTTVDNGTTAWTSTYSGSDGYWEVRSNKLVGNYLGEEAVWRSQVINIASLSNITISLDLSGQGSLNASGTIKDYFKVYYILNGGSETQFYNGVFCGEFSTLSISSPVLDGNTVQIVVRSLTTGCDEYFRFDNVKVTGVTNSAISVTASASGDITCNNNQTTLSTNIPATGNTFSWTGPGGFVSTQTNPVVTQSGTYSVTVTNASGCSGSSSVNVQQDITLPNLSKSVSNMLDCAHTSATLTASSTTPNTTFTWTGFPVGLNPVNISSPGKYLVMVTNNTNGCTKKDSVTVQQDVTKPNLSVVAPGKLTCSTLSVSLNASSSTTGATFAWTGYTAGQNPVSTANPGKYYVTATNPANGCTKKDSVTVIQNVQYPGATASVSDTLTCDNTTITLSVSSPASGVTYQWTGPLTFASTEQNPETNYPGLYTITVTNPVNGCSSTAGVTVSQDTSAAENVHATVSGAITCTVNSATINGSTTTAGATYSWTGPGGFSSTNQNNTVTTPGNYILHVTKPSTGCITSTTAAVLIDTLHPKDVVAEASGILSCTRSSVTLTGRSSVSGATYKWVGPGLSSTEASPTVTTPGTYYLTVTNPINGCYSATSVDVIKDLTLPEGVSTSVSGILTCTDLNVTISAYSTTQGVVYSWTGPGSYTSNERTPNVSNPGTYLVTITNPYNDCSVADSVKVQQNIMPPEGVTASVTGKITCSNKTVSIKGASTTSGATYSWAGPNGYTSALQNPIVNTAGRYTLTVTNSANGCTATAWVDVKENTAPPSDVKAEVSGALNCVNAFVMLTGSCSTTGVSYFWTGPDDFMATDPETFAITAGNYKLVITDPTNGCKDSSSITVMLDTVSPVSHIIPPTGSPIALTDDTLTAQVVSNVTYLWGLSSSNTNWWVVSGDNTRKLRYHTGDLGSNATFTLMVTSNQNGCSRVSSIALAAISTKSAPLIADTFQVRVYPNPFTDKAFVEFIPDLDGQVSIELYTANGSLSSTIFNGNVNKFQSYKIIVDGTTISAGSYYFTIRLNNRVNSYKLLLIK